MLLQQRILRSRAKISPRFTTIPVAVLIDGRTQVMKKKIGVSQTTNEILRELVNELAIPVDEEVELSFDAGNGDGISTLQGPECVFCIVMEHVKNTGYRLSEIQLEKIDAVPLIQCRLVLASVGNLHSSTLSITCAKSIGISTFFGRPLEGSSPPQPVLTMIDHLMLHGIDVEGLFRKSPKQSTVRMLRAQLDRGSVPDFYQFNPHVTAALLKEYLREIPGNYYYPEILNYGHQQWNKRLLHMLPSAHYALLSKFLRLLRAIANSPQSKMTAQSLAVCIAPSLLDNPKGDSATSWLPDLAEYLIVNAPSLLEPFKDVQLAISSSVSNDSGLSDVDLCLETSVSTSDSGVIESPASSCSLGVSQSPKLTYSKWEHRPLQTSSSGYFTNIISTECEEDEENVTEVEQEDNDKTPVLSRENSDVQNKSITPMWRWKKSEEKRKTEEKPFSRGPSICSNASKKNTIINDESGDKRSITDYKLRREFGTSSPCRRKIEGSPVSLRRSATLEGSPSSNRKSVTFDPDSPVSVRKSSTISTASLHSDSTLQASVPTELPESPILLRRGSSKRAERNSIIQRKTTNSMIDSGIHFASPLPPRRREMETQGLSSPITRRKDLEANSHSPVIRRKESLLSQSRRESFRRQSENNNSDPGPSNIRDNVIRKYSFPEGKIWYDDDVSTYHQSMEETKSFQMPVITSPILRTTSNHNKLLVRRASERVGGVEGTVSKLFSRQSPLLKSDLKQNSVSIVDLNSISNKFGASNTKDITIRSNPDNHNRINKMETQITSNIDLRHSTTNEIRKTTSINANRIQPKLSKQPSIKLDANKCSTETFATPIKNDIQSRVSLQQRERNSSVRIRKKTRSILMEPLEVNWSVDEIRSKFQKASEPPPFLDTIYSSYSLK
ncbi:Rho GTPase-activating protein 20 [Dirofilaria immitis]|nr:Rho GTPase-activating protein 20 [Dirofilaria immitis]